MAILNIADKESGLSVRNKLNTAIDRINGPDTVVALKLLSLDSGVLIETKGNKTAGDMGGRPYFIQTSGQFGGTPDEFNDITLANGNIAVGQSVIAVTSTQGGIVGDDVADDTSALTSLLVLDDVVINSGPIRVVSEVPITANTIIDGASEAKVRFNTTTTTSKEDFDLTAGNISIKGLHVEHDGIAAETAQIFPLQGSNLTLMNMEIDANHTAVFDNAVNAFFLDNTNVENIDISHSEIHNVNRVMLRSNAATGTLENFTFSYNHCHDLGESGMQFNFPNGSVTGVKVIGNYFNTFVDGTEQIFMGGASVKQGIFSHNITVGVANESVHLEEGATDILVTDNILRVTDGDGVFLTDNDVGGVFKKPNRITICNDIIVNPGTPTATTGIAAQEDGTGIDSYENLIAKNNQISGYNIGMNLGLGSQLVTGNIIDSCTTGIRMFRGDPNVEGNIIRNCTNGFTISSRGGLLGKNTFENVTNIADTDGGEKVSMAGFKTIKNTDVTLPAGITNINIGIDVGSEMFGEAKVSLHITPTAFQHRISTIDYDGTTLVDTELMRNGSGVINLNGFINNSGQLAVQLNNTGAEVTLKALTVDFDGMWVSAS